MSEQAENIGVIITNCDGNAITAKELESIANGLEKKQEISRKNVVYLGEVTLAKPEVVADTVRTREFTKTVIAGLPTARGKRFLESVAEEADVPRGSLYSVYLGRVDRKKSTINLITEKLSRAVESLSLMPHFEKKRIPIEQSVLVIGGGVAGAQTAAALNSYGYETTLIEKEDTLGGELSGSLKDFSGKHGAEFSRGLENITVYTGTTLARLEGSVGNYQATLDTPEGRKDISCGSCVLAPGIMKEGEWLGQVMDEPSEFLVPVEELHSRVEAFPKVKKERYIGIVLDLFYDETKASTEMALSLARSIQERNLFQAYLFIRDVRVSSLELEEFYDKVRDAGVNIIKYTELEMSAEEDAVVLSCKDSILQTPITVSCDLVGVSRYGVRCAVDPELAEITGIDLDSYGQLQDNNIHLFPGETNRDGVYVVGSARGTYYVPDIIQEAKAVAETVHNVLSQKTMLVELSHADVDPDKCILCLTCIRSCPYKAMYIDHEKGAAQSLPEACKRCGICAGECPAKAITLPIYSDDIVLGQMA